MAYMLHYTSIALICPKIWSVLIIVAGELFHIQFAKLFLNSSYLPAFSYLVIDSHINCTTLILVKIEHSHELVVCCMS